MELSQLVHQIRSYPGITRKRPIKDIFNLFTDMGYGVHLPNYGDDAAAIPWKDGYLLLAADGIMTKLLVNEPYAAGKSSVMVTVNDIYAMGGRPLAMVNVLASGTAEHRELVAQGIRKGCEKLGVPMVGGHLHPDAAVNAPSLSVAIVGWARKLLRSHLAQPGDDIIFAVDLLGQRGCTSVVSWDANSGKTREELVEKLEAMPLIAEKGLAHSAKDVSNAGLIGTIAIMMENSNRGAIVDVSSLPAPDGMSLVQWCLCFQSFGFVLAVSPENSEEVLRVFHARKVEAAIVGKVTEDTKVYLKYGQDMELLFDFEKELITGIKYREKG